MLEIALWISGLIDRVKAPSGAEKPTAGVVRPAVEATAHERELFEATVTKALGESLWNETLSYNNGHFLMVPLHAAFLMNEEPWRVKFDEHFQRFVSAPKGEWAKTPLYRYQYLYLPSRYLALAARTGKPGKVDADLTRVLTDELMFHWKEEPAVAYDHKPFRGVGERVRHKMFLPSPPKKSYFKAYTDGEFYAFSIAADLLYVERKTGVKNPHSATLREIVGLATRILREESTFTREGGWLFQVGGWADHPDNSHNGHTESKPGLQPKLKRDIPMDTSHFHRFPMYVNSLRDAHRSESKDRKFMDKIVKALGKQMSSVVLVPPSSSAPFWRTKNYMDGWNGVYRYTSKKIAGRGFGPYQLSGTFLMGWWSVLDDPMVKRAYKEISQSFPLSEDAMKTYVGPGYKAPPRSKSWYENGIAELATSLGARIPPLDGAPD